jgi:hypothetical protein
LVAAGAGVLMARRSLIDLMTLRLAFERSGKSVPVPVADPASPPLPPETVEALENPTAAEPDEPNRGKIEWVVRPHVAPVGRINWDYNPWSRERLK